MGIIVYACVSQTVPVHGRQGRWHDVRWLAKKIFHSQSILHFWLKSPNLIWKSEKWSLMAEDAFAQWINWILIGLSSAIYSIIFSHLCVCVLVVRICGARAIRICLHRHLSISLWGGLWVCLNSGFLRFGTQSGNGSWTCRVPRSVLPFFRYCILSS